MSMTLPGPAGHSTTGYESLVSNKKAKQQLGGWVAVGANFGELLEPG